MGTYSYICNSFKNSLEYSLVIILSLDLLCTSWNYLEERKFMNVQKTVKENHSHSCTFYNYDYSVRFANIYYAIVNEFEQHLQSEIGSIEFTDEI